MRACKMQHQGRGAPRRHTSCSGRRLGLEVMQWGEGQQGRRRKGTKECKQQREHAPERFHSTQLHREGQSPSHFAGRNQCCRDQNSGIAHGSTSRGDGNNHAARTKTSCMYQNSCRSTSRRGQSHLGSRWSWPLQPNGRGRDWKICVAQRSMSGRGQKRLKTTPCTAQAGRRLDTSQRRPFVPGGAILLVALLAAVAVPCASSAELAEGGGRVLSEQGGLGPRVGGLRGHMGMEAWPEQSIADPVDQPRALKPEACQNTLQGRTLVSDDRGFTCKRWDLNFRTGCCTTGNQSKSVHLRVSSKSLLVFPRTQVLPLSASSSPPSLSGRFSCATCNLTQRCCSVYEYCVSCCLDPERTPASLALATPRAKQASAAMFGSVFEFCTTQCRHNSKSVVHENAYISEMHHCFALPHAPAGLGSATSAPQSASDQLGRIVKPVVAAQAVSCDDACARQSMRCDSSFLPVLNNCSVMHQYLACRGGCLYSAGPDQPAEVVDLAPPRQLPGACMLNSNTAMFSCSGTHEHTRRLCPCRDWLS